MAGAFVLVFLLDELPGFNRHLNATLHSIFNTNLTSQIQSCNSTVAYEVLTMASKASDLLLVPAWRERANNLEDSETSDNFSKLDSNLDSGDTNSINIRETDGYRRNYDVSDCDGTFLREVKLNGSSKTQFPQTAPFLVAIFETLSNVTAQTCAGTLMAPNWVVTAATCLNMLRNLYPEHNSSESRYTIIAGSNPLEEGAGHNVTKVIVHPTGNDTNLAQNTFVPPDALAQAKSPLLALLRIEPGIPDGAVRIVDGAITGRDVMVYGWVVKKNASGADILTVTRMSATILATAQCHAMYPMRRDILCLFNNAIEKNITQLSSGAAVLAVHNDQVRMLAVAQTDEHLFVAYSLAAHLPWLQNVLSGK